MFSAKDLISYRAIVLAQQAIKRKQGQLKTKTENMKDVEQNLERRKKEFEEKEDDIADAVSKYVFNDVEQRVIQGKKNFMYRTWMKEQAQPRFVSFTKKHSYKPLPFYEGEENEEKDAIVEDSEESDDSEGIIDNIEVANEIKLLEYESVANSDKPEGMKGDKDEDVVDFNQLLEEISKKAENEANITAKVESDEEGDLISEERHNKLMQIMNKEIEEENKKMSISFPDKTVYIDEKHEGEQEEQDDTSEVFEAETKYEIENPTKAMNVVSVLKVQKREKSDIFESSVECLETSEIAAESKDDSLDLGTEDFINIEINITEEAQIVTVNEKRFAVIRLPENAVI